MTGGVAVLLATYQGAAFLDRQLQSLRDQDWPHWRLVVSDDGSTDATRDIVGRFARDNPDRDIALVDGPRQGATRNFLSLVAQVRSGEWLAFCDQDDAWLPHRLSRGMEMIGEGSADQPPPATTPAHSRTALSDDQRPPNDTAHPAATASRTIICDVDLNPLTPAPMFRRAPGFRNALVQACMPGNTFLANPAAATIMREAAPAAAAAGVVSHDWWAYQLLSGAGARLVRDPEPTVLYRQHPSNVMGRNDTWRARLARIAMLRGGEYGGWLRTNVAALDAVRDLLTPENRALLDRFASVLDAPGPVAAARLRGLGVYRQTRVGTAALFAAAMAGSLRGSK